MKKKFILKIPKIGKQQNALILLLGPFRFNLYSIRDYFKKRFNYHAG